MFDNQDLPIMDNRWGGSDEWEEYKRLERELLRAKRNGRLKLGSRKPSSSQQSG